MPFEKDPNELGALWIRDGRKGQFLSGQIDGVDVICFPVQSQNPKAPAWRVMKSEPREQRAPSRDTVPAPTDDDLSFI